MGSRTVLVITLVPGTPRLHLWCNRCMTSAGFEVSLYRLAPNGVHLFGTVRRCDRCDRED